ncbi:MAG: LysM peptidoglycan-binding domain-containing protein [Planctomycetes bacterium]|nr:LysM peptidoglycan-binding domain-containing protein [Planctomycetota bacterium]
MVKSNAARHLLCIIMVLIFFFVYIGSRLWERQVAVGAPEIAGLIPVQEAAGTTVMTVGEAPPETAPTVRAPIATPSGSRLAPGNAGDGEAIPDLSQLNAPPARDRDDPPVSTRPPTGLAAPSGSFEESVGTPGAITGLVPADGRTDVPAVRPAAAADAGSEDLVSAGYLTLPPAGGGLKPPAEEPLQLALPPLASSEPASPPIGGAVSRPIPPVAAPSPTPPVADTVAVRPRDDRLRPADPAPAVTSRPDSGRQPTPSYEDGDDDLPASQGLRYYIIRPGDTLTRIAQNEVGSASLANNIYLFNRNVIDNPDHLVVGTRILLPAREEESRDFSPAAAPGGSTAGTGNQVRIHRVVSGDTLSSIALQYYGSSAAWRYLYEANADVIANPNQLRVGTSLAIPPYGDRR